MEVIPHPEGLESLWVVAPEYDADFEVSGCWPVQSFGTVCGRDLYFRARDNVWTFEVADADGQLHSNGRSDADGFHFEGRYPNADWMPLDDAVEIIVHCLKEYTGVGV